MRYKVTVQRVEYREHAFEVEGATLVDAESNALVAAGNHDFNQERVCYVESEVIQVVETGCPATKRIWIGGESGVIEREEDLRRAATFEQRLSDQFNPIPGAVVVSEPEEPGDPWTLVRDNVSRTELLELPQLYPTQEAAQAAADKLNEEFWDSIASKFPCVEIPADWDVHVSSPELGKYPQSRSCVVHINGDADKIHWKARGAADKWIPKPLVAAYIRTAVQDAENKSKHITTTNNADKN